MDWNNGISEEWNDGFGIKRKYLGMFTHYSNIPRFHGYPGYRIEVHKCQIQY